MNNFPFKLLGGMTALFVFMCIGLHLIFSIVIDFMGFTPSEESYLIISFVFSVICFALVSLYAVLPLNGAIKYLELLLNQPKTENIRVEEEGFLDTFKYAEWGELGELVRKVERKLRRRTKALLRETTELSAVMNSLGSPIVAINSQMEVAFLNSSFAVLFDVSDAKLGRRDKAEKIETVIKVPEVVDVLKSAIQNEDFNKRMISFTPSGEKFRIFSLSLEPLRRMDSSIYGLVATFVDETVKVELEQKRMDFVANASHELRTPIAAVSTSVSLLDKVDDPETRKQVMDSLSLNSDRLVSLAHDLLDLSKLEEETEEIDVGEVDLKTLSDEVLLGLSHSNKNLVEFSYDIQEAVFDGSKVKQVLTNLLRNALIYTPDKTKIEVSWYNEAGSACLKVKDWGQGIPAAEHNRIFERFYRVDKSRSRTSGGSGIGLSIVKHIMNLHDGEVKLEPYKEGEGATFVCSFPQ